MLRDPGEPVDDLVIEMMREVPKHKQRIAGKSIPVEKFAIHKAEKCLAQGNRLMLPGLVSQLLSRNVKRRKTH